MKERKSLLRDSFELINREVEVAGGLSSSDLAFCFVVFAIVYLMIGKFNFAVVAGGLSLIVLSKLKKEVGTTERIISYLAYFVRPKRYCRK